MEETFVQLIFRRSSTVGSIEPWILTKLAPRSLRTLIRVNVELHRACSTSDRLFRRLNPEKISISRQLCSAFYDSATPLSYQVFSFSLIAYNACILRGGKVGKKKIGAERAFICIDIILVSARRTALRLELNSLHSSKGRVRINVRACILPNRGL